MASNAGDLRFYFVWQPVLPSDDRMAANIHLAAEKDARARHYFDEDLRLGHAFAKPLATPYDDGPFADAPLAWDVVMVLDGAARWTDALPAPKLHMFPQPTKAGAPGFTVARLQEAVG